MRRLWPRSCANAGSPWAQTGYLLVYPSKIADVKMRIFNSDGSEAEMCGNGIRCFSKYCYENGIVKEDRVQGGNAGGHKACLANPKRMKLSSVKVDMGAPNWERNALPMTG